MLRNNQSIRFFILLLVCLATIHAQDYVAVLEFDGSGMSKIEARNITERFSFELQQTRKFILIERQALEQIIGEQKVQLSGCVADECAVEVGKLAGARYVIAGSVTKTFGLYGIAVRLIDVESGEIVTHILESDEADVQKFVSQRVRNAAMRMAAEGGIAANSTSHEEKHEEKLVSISEKGSVVFTLNKVGSALWVNDLYMTKVNSESTTLKLPEGLYQIKFTLAGHKDWVKSLNLISDETLNYEVDFELGLGSGDDTVETGILVVRSEPVGAIAYLDGVSLGPTPAQNTKVGVGKHIIRVEKPLYHPYNEEISIVPDGIEQVQVTLAPNFGTLTVLSEPSGALVKLNGQNKGSTPLDLPELISGDYIISLSKDLYYNSEENYSVMDGSDNEYKAVLHPAFGKLSIVTIPEDVSVYLDGQFRGVSPLNLDEIPSGLFRIKVSRELYETQEKQITIEDGKTNHQMIELIPRFGKLTVTGSPASAKVYVNNKLIGNLSIIDEPIGTGLAQIRVTELGYHDHEDFLQVNNNEIYSLNVTLEQKTGTVIVTSTPPGATLHLDGNEIGLTPQILKMVQIGKHQITISHPAYAKEVREFHLELGEREEFNLELGAYESTATKQTKRQAALDKIPFYGVLPAESPLYHEINQSLAENAWPGGVLFGFKDGRDVNQVSFGTHTYSREKNTHSDDIFDLSSLTKVISTTSAVMRLYEDGKLNLDSYVKDLLPNFMNSNSNNYKSQITVNHLLTHTSGLPPFKRFYLMEGQTKDALWDSVIACNPNIMPGQEYRYSDIGSMLVGKIVEQVSGVPLDAFVREEVFDPLGMRDTDYLPQDKFDIDRIVPTEYDEEGILMHGIVLDENCSALGGVSGHNGLFSTAKDLSKFCQMMLNGGSIDSVQVFRPETIELFTRRANIVNGSSRCLGWDSPASAISGGVYLSSDSYGHTGFTGTSLWIDPENQMYVILLTNAVHPDRSYKYPNYFDWRQKIHASLYESVGFSQQNADLTWRDRWVMKQAADEGGFLAKWKYNRYVKSHTRR